MKTHIHLEKSRQKAVSQKRKKKQNLEGGLDRTRTSLLTKKKNDGLKMMDGGGEPIRVKHPLKALPVGCFPDGRGEIYPEDFTAVNDETQRRAEESLPPPPPVPHLPAHRLPPPPPAPASLQEPVKCSLLRMDGAQCAV